MRIFRDSLTGLICVSALEETHYYTVSEIKEAVTEAEKELEKHLEEIRKEKQNDN